MADDNQGPASAVAPTAYADASGAHPTQPEAASGTSATQGPIGRIIKGRYKIKRLLGEGGMGGVYEGEHLEIGKRVAIKLVHSLHARDSHIAARIKQEARSTSAVESEHIVQVFDAGEDEELGIFLVMELLKGEDLGNILARKKRLGVLTAAALIAQAAQGLARAHAAGIVHRDLKPANIYICNRDDGSSLVKLVDFGIAKLLRDAQAAAGGGGGLTRMGMVIGTPQYMSPEQAQGLPTVDHKTDIYSLGAVLFETIVGAPPYQEMPTYEQTILQIMTQAPPRLSQLLPDVNPEIDQLVADMMSHDVAKRPNDMMEVRARLIHAFPEIENSRAPLRSISNEAALEATSLDPRMGDQIRAAVEAARKATGSGPGAAVSMRRPGTNSAVAVNAVPDEDMDAAAIPQRKSGALIGAVAVIALVAGIGIAALVKMKGGDGDAKPATAGFGLVQSTPPVAAPAVTAMPALQPAAAAPQATAPQPVAAVASEAPAKPAAPAKPTGGGRGKPGKGAPAAAPEAPAGDRPVGGTGVSTEF